MIKFLKNLFKQSSPIDLYIASKYPKSAGEVDYWMNRYYLDRR
jgi:hypothetical protein